MLRSSKTREAAAATDLLPINLVFIVSDGQLGKFLRVGENVDEVLDGDLAAQSLAEHSHRQMGQVVVRSDAT